MLEFIQVYGLWIALAGVFAAMHWFGMGCCGQSGHRHGSTRGEDAGADDAQSGQRVSKPPDAGPVTVDSKGGCH